MTEQITAVDYESFFLLAVLEKYKKHTYKLFQWGIRNMGYLFNNLPLFI